jgi:ribosomal protein L37AE/L43A
MKKQLLYVMAFNENGILVKANDAEKIGKYFCPICKNELILRKSGKVGKGSKRPHFAHYHLTENCTPEGALHYSFKKMLFEKIKDNIKNSIVMNMTWECNYCHKRHEGNLLKKVFDVKDEYDMNICRPDIALSNEKGNVFVVIEIVVTHKPDDNVINYYKVNNIILIQINLDSEDDLENINEKLNNPSIC